METNAIDDLQDANRHGVHAAGFAWIYIAVVVMIAYLPELTSSFGDMDDYGFLHDAVHGTHVMVDMVSGAGRPLNAALLRMGFAAAGSIENLVFLRAITLVGIWALGGAIYLFASRSGVRRLPSVVMACAVVLLPSFQVYASWAQHLTTPYAGVLALLGAHFLTPACALWERSKLLAVVLAAGLLLVANLVYQPIAMLFCTGILISITATSDASEKWRWERLMGVAAAFAMAMILSFIVFKLGQIPAISHAERYGIVHDIPQKLHWFVHQPLMNALNLYRVPSTVPLAVAVAMLLLAGASSLFRFSRPAASLTTFVLGIACILASYTPSLLTGENWASYRSLCALAVSFAVIVVIVGTRVLDHVRSSYPRLAVAFRWRYSGRFVVGAFLLLMASQAQKNVVNSFVQPNVAELDNLASFLKRQTPSATGEVTIIVKAASWMDSSARPMAYDEFGMPSSIADQYAKNIVEAVNLGMGLFPKAAILTTAEVDPHLVIKASNGTDGIFLVNFPALTTSQRFAFSARAN